MTIAEKIRTEVSTIARTAPGAHLTTDRLFELAGEVDALEKHFLDFVSFSERATVRIDVYNALVIRAERLERERDALRKVADEYTIFSEICVDDYGDSIETPMLEAYRAEFIEVNQ